MKFLMFIKHAEAAGPIGGAMFGRMNCHLGADLLEFGDVYARM